MTTTRSQEAQRYIAAGFRALQGAEPLRAAEYCRKAISLEPKSSQAHFLVGLVALEMEDRRTAIRAFGSVTKLDPTNAAAFAHLARLFMRLGQPARAEKALAAANALAPSEASVVDLIGVVTSMLGDQKAAKALYRRAVERAPESEEHRINLASACMFLGENEEAIEALSPLLAREAPPAQAEWLVSSIRKQGGTERPARLLHRARMSSKRDAAFLAYAAGKEFEDCEAWEKAFEAFDFGAKSRRAIIEYDERAEIDRFEAMQDAFNDGFATRDSMGCDDPSPIFVVGQPRTGTTLIERIISSHSQVESAGELQQFRLSLGRLSQGTDGQSADEKTITDLVEAWRRISPRALGEEYLRASRPMRSGAPRFVDKLPGNYFFVPLILAALPNARIVHLTRDPMDACFACFKQLFADAYLHSYDQEEMARHYARYWRLMDHWRRAFPGAFFDIAYEDVVADVESNARRLVEFLGLQWEDQCLRFYEQDAAVATASAVQVREKPHTRSVGRWRRYGAQLEPMRHQLAAEGIIE